MPHFLVKWENESKYIYSNEDTRHRLKAARRLYEPSCYRGTIVFDVTSKRAAVIWDTRLYELKRVI
jgi:hypothetical protein